MECRPREGGWAARCRRRPPLGVRASTPTARGCGAIGVGRSGPGFLSPRGGGHAPNGTTPTRPPHHPPSRGVGSPRWLRFSLGEAAFAPPLALRPPPAPVPPGCTPPPPATALRPGLQPPAADGVVGRRPGAPWRPRHASSACRTWRGCVHLGDAAASRPHIAGYGAVEFGGGKAGRTASVAVLIILFL